MKKIILSLAITVVSLHLLSCKKDDTPASKTTQEKLAGKWGLVSTYSEGHSGGLPFIYSYTGKPADYADFKSDNKVYTFFDAVYDTIPYGVISNDKMWLDNPTDTFEIQILTDIDLKIHMKKIYSPTVYSETTSIFKK